MNDAQGLYLDHFLTKSFDVEMDSSVKQGVLVERYRRVASSLFPILGSKHGRVESNLAHVKITLYFQQLNHHLHSTFLEILIIR